MEWWNIYILHYININNYGYDYDDSKLCLKAQKFIKALNQYVNAETRNYNNAIIKQEDFTQQKLSTF